MGKIKKILENELVGGIQDTDVYPVTSTKAVYNEENKTLDETIETINTNLKDKVDKEKLLSKYIFSVIDKNNKIIFSILPNGDIEHPIGLNSLFRNLNYKVNYILGENKSKYLFAFADRNGKVAFGILPNGKLVGEINSDSIKGLTEEIQRVKDILEEQIDNIDTELSAINNSVNKQNEQINSIKSDIYSILTDLQAKVEKLSTNRQLGYFSTLEKLKLKYPESTLEDGTYALVGGNLNSESTWSIYTIENNVWTDTGFTFNANVNLTEYATKQYVIDSINNGNNSYGYSDSSSIIINNQEEFSKLKDTISNYLNTHEEGELNIILKGGMYTFNDEDLKLENIERPGIYIYISASPGEEVNVIGNGEVFNISDADRFNGTHYILPFNNSLQGGEVFIDENFQEVKTSDSGLLSDDNINIVNKGDITYTGSVSESNLTFKIKVPDYLKSYLPDSLSGDNKYKNNFVYIFCWYQYFLCHIDYVTTDKGVKYINIKTEDAISIGDYWVNQLSIQQSVGFYITNIYSDNQVDSLYIKETTRNEIYIPRRVKSLRMCSQHNWITFSNCNFGKFKITGVNFSGSSSFTEFQSTNLYYNTKTSTLLFKNCSNIEIENNTIRNIGTWNFIYAPCNVIADERNNTSASNMNEWIVYPGIINSNNLKFINNKCKNARGGILNSSVGNTLVKYNSFSNISTFFRQNGIIRLSGKNYDVKYNTFKNFGYSAVFIGLKNSITTLSDEIENGPREISGYFQYNIVFNDEEYKKHPARYFLSDGGLVYVSTENTDTKIYNNIIHGGVSYNDIKNDAGIHGIFLDDFAYNVDIQGNVIYDVVGRCVDARKPISQSDIPYIPTGEEINNNNILKNNVILGYYRFEGKWIGSGKGTNYKGKNIIGPKIGTYTTSTVVDVSSSNIEDDVIDNDMIIINNIIFSKLAGEINLPMFIKSQFRQLNK